MGRGLDERPPPSSLFVPMLSMAGRIWDLGAAGGDSPDPAQETHPLLQRQRRRALQQQQRRFKLARFAPGLPWARPQCSAPDLDLLYSIPKAAAFYLRGGAANLETKLKGFLDRAESWQSLDAITRIFCFYHTPVTDYVVKHWQEDSFFGAQYLNGVNPVLLRRCTRLPHNLAVTPQMVAKALGPHTDLQKEMEEGRMFLADYALLDGINGVEIDGRPTYLCAPICLLHLGGDGELRPVAIQLQQKPGPSNPVLVPEDPPWLWALAKAWVRSADFQVHEAITHLLRAHLLGEVFAMATRRQLATQHPIYKLLLPHTRYTVHIATLARRFLLNPGGVFDQAIAVGRSGLIELVARGLKSLRYRDLLLPNDLRNRGVHKVPGYHFGSDASKIWAAIKSFVSGIVHFYYPCDGAVRRDPELQAWVKEIFHKGFLGRKRSGFPSSLRSVRSLIRFVTMIIYTCSAHHAATNSGQFELGSFMPNMPAAMRAPPPSHKSPLSLHDFLDSLPAVNTTCRVLSVLWVLRNEPIDMLPLGHYPDRHFTEPVPLRSMSRFRRRLNRISQKIRNRNRKLQLPYPYLDPSNVENSVAI